MKFGLLHRWGSLWVGAHWSPGNKRLCINVIPTITLWITLKDGIPPK